MNTSTPNLRVMMLRPNLVDLPRPQLPSPFSLRWYRPGDEQAWRDIHILADPFHTFPPERFREEFGDDDAHLAQRQAYLLDEDRTPIGTAAAWTETFDGIPSGLVHWVAITPKYQGRGLSKPLLAAILQRFLDLGHDRAYLRTSTARLPAIRLYRSMGFEPLIRTPDDAAAWASIA